MRFSDSGSWSFRQADSQWLHVALFARDAAGIPVPSAADIPPRLLGQLAVREQFARVDNRALVATQWQTWWRYLLNHLANDAHQRWEEERSSVTARLTAMADRQREAFDPPAFQTLVPMSELRTLVVATFDDGLKWSWHLFDPARQDDDGHAFGWAAIREAAENAAIERGIPLGDLRGVAYVVHVEGQWSYLVSPGCGICSSAVAASPDATKRFLRELFSSSASGPPGQCE